MDAHVGAAMRRAREAVDWRLADLAQHLGVSLQQVQKYESGEVRMSASTLAAASVALSIPIEAFFAGLPDPTQAPDAVSRRSSVGLFLREPDGHDMAVALARLPPDQRRGVLGLLRTLIGIDGWTYAAGPTRSPPPGKE